MAQGFFICQCAGGTSLHTLAAECTLRIAQVIVELGSNLSVETAIHNADGVIAFLLGTDTHTAIAGNAQIIIPQDEGILIIQIAVP